MWTDALIPLSDGRQLETLTTGPEDGIPLVMHNGTPGGPVPNAKVAAAAEAAGVFLVVTGRPGYGRSTPKRGRTVADVAADIAQVLDHLGLSTFVTAGASGGGPHALACAALLPDRCLAAATIAGVGPYRAEGLDFLGDMGEENVEEFGLAIEGRDQLAAWMAEQVAGLGQATPDIIVQTLGTLLPPVDKAVVTGELAETMVTSMRKAFEVGQEGWMDDDLAFVKPWGFELADITVPVTVWQGALDMMVPFAHGKWLAASIPGAQSRLFDDHGHLSLAVAHLPAIFEDLLTRAKA